MAVTLGNVTVRLRELIAALDRRVPRPARSGEIAIARDAAALREQAVDQLAEIASRAPWPASPHGVGPGPAAERMHGTPFPATPADVAVLTVQEFTFDLEDLEQDPGPSLDRISRLFTGDANRALVWWIRFRALRAWRTRADIAHALTSGSLTPRDACELAAGFALNEQWEFEAESFRSALAAVAAGRADTRTN